MSAADHDGEAGDTALRERPSRYRPSSVWLIPLGAALIGLWLLYHNWMSRGPEITLAIDTAEGLEAGKTLVKVRSVEVGRLTGVRLADDYRGAVATVQMNPDTEELLVADSRFWVVKPRIGRQGISGLGTILSGAYIELAPGQSDRAQRRFTIQENPPALSSDEPGVSITLASDSDEALAVGDPVVYLGQNVGQVESSEFVPEQRRMSYRVFVREPFAELVTEQTQFWLRSGIDLSLDAEGVSINTGSLQTILAGGVTFGLPDDVAPGASVANDANFELYDTRNAALQDRYERKIRYVILLDDSVRGLNDGAPVEYRGLRVGTVEEVPFFRPDFELREFSSFKIPVLISIEPQRPANSWTNWSDQEWRDNNRRFFSNGLRATIKSGNLLTGSTFIDLQFDSGASGYDADRLGGYEVFPSQPSSITSIQTQLSNLMDKLNAIDIRPIAESVERTMRNTNDTLEQLEQATRNINRLLGSEAAQQLPGDARRVLEDIETTLDSYQQGAPAYQELERSLRQLNRVLDDVGPLAETLRDNPNALIFGGPEGREDPVPRAPR